MRALAIAMVSSIFVVPFIAFGEPAAQPSTESFRAFLATWERGQEQFVNGDPTLWKQNLVSGNSGTIFGAFGGFEQGVDVPSRYDWAASQYVTSGATKSIQYLNTAVSGELALTVSIERDTARTVGQDGATERALRVTQVFRWENSSWKLLHRHADPLTERRAPERAQP